MPVVKLRKVGNSLVATIPALIAEQMHLEPAMEVDAMAEGGRLVFVPCTVEFEKGIEAYRKVTKKYAGANRELAK